MNTVISKLRLQGFDVTFEKGNCVLRRYTGNESDVHIPDEVQIIGNCAFFDKKIRTVTFGENIKHICSGAFEKCGELSFISPLKNVEKIDSYAFAYTIKLRNVEFSDKLTYIGECAFNGSGIERADIPCSVNHVDFKAFFACHKLSEANIDGNDAIYGESCFANCRNLNTTNIRKGVKMLGRRAFSYCKNLTSVKLPSTVLLGEDAFEAVNPEVITITD